MDSGSLAHPHRSGRAGSTGRAPARRRSRLSRKRRQCSRRRAGAAAGTSRRATIPEGPFGGDVVGPSQVLSPLTVRMDPRPRTIGAPSPSSWTTMTSVPFGTMTAGGPAALRTATGDSDTANIRTAGDGAGGGTAASAAALLEGRRRRRVQRNAWWTSRLTPIIHMDPAATMTSAAASGQPSQAQRSARRSPGAGARRVRWRASGPRRAVRGGDERRTVSTRR